MSVLNHHLPKIDRQGMLEMRISDSSCSLEHRRGLGSIQTARLSSTIIMLAARVFVFALVILFVTGGISAKGRSLRGSEAFAASALPSVTLQGETTYTSSTNLNTPLTQRVYLKRETNCHLTSTTINSASPNKVVSSVQNFELTLHNTAQLDSTPDVFTGGARSTSRANPGNSAAPSARPPTAITSSR
jgi:hypothetical protein